MRTLETKRLILRQVSLKDAGILYQELGCYPEMIRYTGWNPYNSEESATEKIKQDIANSEREGFYSWIIEADGRPIGTIGAYGYDQEISSIEIGYSIFRAEWGHRYASEAAARVVKFLIHEEGINRVHAWCHCENLASAAVLESAGLRQEGLLRQAMRNPDGTYADQKLFGIVKDDYDKA